MITIEESAVVVFGINDEPAYLLTITALSPEITPTKNKRIAALTQEFLEDALEIPSNQGIVRFVGIADGDLAIGGTTTLGEIESLTQQRGEARTCVRAKCRRSRKTLKPTFLNFGRTSRAGTMITPPESKEESDATILNSRPSQKFPPNKRSSLMAFFGR